jgi:ubiquinone/menaquinone biosynthesis C-methylase UbiE
MERRFTFDRVADLYDAARPSYPDALLDHIVAFAGLKPGDPVLEIGCGTGKATAGFARRGLHVVALDPGAELLRVARKSLTGFQNVQFLQTTFEAWPPQPAAFELVAAAQSWHWIAPEVRCTKVAEVLAPGGSLAVFGNEPVGLTSSPLLDEFKRIYAHHVPTLWEHFAAEAWYLPTGPVAKLIGESRLFAAITYESYPWRRSHTGSSFTDLLRTQSRYQLLAEPQREALFAALAGAIAAHGGEFELAYEAHLYLAKRSS